MNEVCRDGHLGGFSDCDSEVNISFSLQGGGMLHDRTRALDSRVGKERAQVLNDVMESLN